MNFRLLIARDFRLFAKMEVNVFFRTGEWKTTPVVWCTRIHTSMTVMWGFLDLQLSTSVGLNLTPLRNVRLIGNFPHTPNLILKKKVSIFFFWMM